MTDKEGVRVNKRELVEAIAGQVDAPRSTVEDVLERFMDTVGTTLNKGEKVSLTGFGVFERRDRAARTGQNPQTGEKIRIKASKVPAFKAGQGLRSAVSGQAAKKTAKKAAGKKAAGKKAAGKKAAGKKAAGKKAARKKAAGAKKAGAKKAGGKKAGGKKVVKKSAKKA